MKRIFNSCLILALVLLCHGSWGQTNRYQFKRELSGVSDSWHRLVLPSDLFGRAKEDFSDLRIIGLRTNRDTVVVPYLLQVLEEEKQRQEVAFKLLNQSRQGNRYFFTLEVPALEEINRIELSFQEKNFDRKIVLEGSQGMENWFTILEDYRIVSISNPSTTYAFSTLHFSRSDYRYYRISFSADQEPVLTTAKVVSEKIKPGQYRTYPLQAITEQEEKKRKETVVDVSLVGKVPVSYIHLAVQDTVDYYRPVKIQYLADSAETAKGWRYYYKTVMADVLSSLEDGAFYFPNTLSSKWRILIDNQDNAPLRIEAVTVKGNVYELIARFPEAETYYLLYGNETAIRPVYDLENFKERIPADLKALQLGEEQQIGQGSLVQASPLFQDQRWLWAVIIIMILLLGWFSVKMIRKA